MVHILGDTHGNMMEVMDAISYVDCGDTLIHVGDFGLGFVPFMKDVGLLTQLSGLCASKDVNFYILRGNHDDPSFFRGLVMDFPHIHLVQDFSTHTIEGETYLFVGGAESVDRNHRIHNKLPHWDDAVIDANPDEVSTDDLALRIGMDLDPDLVIDVVVTHSAPSEFAPLASNTFVLDRFATAYNDPRLLEDCLAERALLSRLFAVTRPKKWYYGHFHASHKKVFEDCEYTCCNINELVEHSY